MLFIFVIGSSLSFAWFKGVKEFIFLMVGWLGARYQRPFLAVSPDTKIGRVVLGSISTHAYCPEQTIQLNFGLLTGWLCGTFHVYTFQLPVFNQQH